MIAADEEKIISSLSADGIDQFFLRFCFHGHNLQVFRFLHKSKIAEIILQDPIRRQKPYQLFEERKFKIKDY